MLETLGPTMNQTLISPLAQLLPKLDAAAAARARLLCSHPLEQALSHWVPGLTLLPVSNSTKSPVNANDGYFGAVLEGQRVAIDLRVPVSIDAVCAAIVSAGAWSQAVQLRCWLARVNSCLAPLLRGLEQLGLRVAYLVARPEPLAPEPTDSLFECHIDGQRIQGRLRCDDTDRLLALEAALQRVSPIRLGNASHWPLPLRLRLGTRRLALGLLHSLEVGDVLLLDQHTEDAQWGHAACVVLGDLRGRGAVVRACSVDQREIKIQGDHWMNAETLVEHTSGAEAGEAAEVSEATANADARSMHSPMAQVEVDLHLELHAMTAPLAELAAMRPGYVLELPLPATQVRVSLVVGGQVVGRAEMVSVGERLGARILDMFHDAR
jgi:type III secretion protein Q